MGIFSTLYAHYRLNAMVRTWRKAAKVMDRLESFILTHADEKLRMEFAEAQTKLDAVMEKVITDVEDKTISELKERV